jgi:hypothetical protein
LGIYESKNKMDMAGFGGGVQRVTVLGFRARRESNTAQV